MTSRHRIGPHHLAHLRAVADGIDVVSAARQYLAIEDQREALAAHNEVTARLRVAARRAGHKHYRLIGIRIRDKLRNSAPPSSTDPTPSLEEYIQEKGLDGWSEEEQLELFLADHPQTSMDIGKQAALQRRERTRQLVVEMLRALEQDGRITVSPDEHDEVSAWFADHIARRLVTAGYLTLGDLAQRIRAGGAWYSGMPGIGKVKASEIVRQLGALLPGITHKPALFPALLQINGAAMAAPGGDLGIPRDAQPGTPYRADNIGGVSTDVGALAAWVDSCAESKATAKSYLREGRRFLFWLAMERERRPLSQVNREDVQAYRTFLAYVPERWIGRSKRVSPGSTGWSPFMGQLSAASQALAQRVLSSWFEWLVNAEYVRANPWKLQRRRGQQIDQAAAVIETKALPEVALNAVIDFIRAEPPSPDQARALFAVRFLSGTGLRSAEFVAARIGDLRSEPEGLVLKVTGKGNKTRVLVLGREARDSLDEYLHFRGLGAISDAPPSAPLFPVLDDPMHPASYQALYKSLKRWLMRSIELSGLTQLERSRLSRASAHWLRHTYGTTAIRRGVPADVVQAEMGHSSIQTTMDIYSRAPLSRRAAEILKALG